MSEEMMFSVTCFNTTDHADRFPIFCNFDQTVMLSSCCSRHIPCAVTEVEISTFHLP